MAISSSLSSGLLLSTLNLELFTFNPVSLPSTFNLEPLTYNLHLSLPDPHVGNMCKHSFHYINSSIIRALTEDTDVMKR